MLAEEVKGLREAVNTLISHFTMLQAELKNSSNNNKGESNKKK